MKYNPLNRRMFLMGSGKALLALPLLTSLLPRKLWAADARPVRFVQIINPYSAEPGIYYGDGSTSSQFAPHVWYRPLQNQSTGATSAILGPAFNPLRAKISLIRGLDGQFYNPPHNYCAATCASGYAKGVDNDEAPPTAGQESVDVLISKSAKMYGSDALQNRKLILMTPMNSDDYSNNRTFSWQKTSSGLEMIRPTKQTSALYDIFASGFGATKVDTGDLNVIQSVYQDYKSTRDSAKISSGDKDRLNNYMDLINDIQKSLQSTPGLTCNIPTRDVETSDEIIVSNQFRVLAAAMACDMTRVGSVTLGMSQGFGTRHGEHHDVYSLPSGFVADMAKNAERVAQFISLLDRISDGDASLLDNSLVYWGMQYGLAKRDDQHCSESYPAMLAGSAGGQMRTGNFVDFRHESLYVDQSNDIRRGIPLNNLMVTIMNCMGLNSADYETSPGSGYGGYESDFLTDGYRPNVQTWHSVSGRRTPLPFLYTGVARG
jgi:hypothetical protein